jgi:DNA-binding response OmpR family regulator
MIENNEQLQAAQETVRNLQQVLLAARKVHSAAEYRFWLDLADEQLWHDERLIALRHKTFAILHYLVEQVGRLVSKEEL